jgi:hypothetical protein
MLGPSSQFLIEAEPQRDFKDKQPTAVMSAYGARRTILWWVLGHSTYPEFTPNELISQTLRREPSQAVASQGDRPSSPSRIPVVFWRWELVTSRHNGNNRESGQSADIAACPLCADTVAKVQNCSMIIFSP